MMIAKKLSPDRETAFIFSRFFLVHHIYHAVDDNLKDVFGLHVLLSAVENNTCWFFGVYDVNGNIRGVCYGAMEGEYFCCHVMFDRKVDAVKGALLCEEELQKYCAQNNIPLKGVVGYPAVNNRAALRFCLRMGYEDKGLSDRVLMQNGEGIPCRKFRKDF